VVLQGGRFRTLTIRVLEAKKNKVSIAFADSTHKIKEQLELPHYESFKLSNRSGTHKALIEFQVEL